ncbi:MAG TPA: cytochrome c biogenesis protein CcsA [Actinomycetota bacterium]|nr:cytochrome c biogenesis protein CcsA [Actinomycetota bacterium]
MKKDPLPVLAGVTATAMLAGLWAVFFWVPTEEFQGVVQRVFYIHVPMAWVAYLAFAVVLVCSIAFLKTNNSRWDTVAHSSAEVGVVFTGICLATGMLWAKPVWGTYWRWDPRLTLTFVLFLIYAGYLVVHRTAADPSRGGRLAAVVGITGFATVPLVHFSVDWWRGQHPGRTVINVEGSPQLPAEMLLTLLFMLAVFTLLYTVLMTLRVRLALLEQRAVVA